MKYLAGAIPLLALVALDAAPAHAWKCCDPWGYRWPHLTKSGCTGDGGWVTYEDECPGGEGLPFKCCNSEGEQFSGFYTSRHACAAAGGTVFPGEWLTCPNAEAFLCCDQAGGSAPGIFGSPDACENAGYEVQAWTLQGCEGGWRDNVVEAVDAFVHGHACVSEVVDTYTLPKGSSTSETVWPANDPLWNDKHTHCTLNCLLASRCGRFWSTVAGWGKEAIDMCDDNYANSWGWGDECANRIGRNFGVDLDGAADDEAQCLEHCTETDDARAACGEGVLGFVQDLSMQATGADLVAQVKGDILANIGALGFGKKWEALIDWCYEFLSQFGLTQSVPTAEVLASLETHVRGLVAFAAAGLGGAEIAQVASDAIVQSLGDARYLVLVRLDQRDVHIEVDTDRIVSIQIRGSTGRVTSITPTPTVESACSTPPCAKRVPWIEWRTPNAAAAVIP